MPIFCGLEVHSHHNPPKRVVCHIVKVVEGKILEVLGGTHNWALLNLLEYIPRTSLTTINHVPSKLKNQDLSGDYLVDKLWITCL